MYTTSRGQSLDLKKCKEITAGGEGKILEHPTKKDKVVKLYHQPRKNSFKNHLNSLAGLPSCFVCPEEVIFNSKDEVAGFSMLFVNMNNYYLFNNLFNKGFCTSHNITKEFKIRLLEKLRKANEELHSRDIQIGDENPYNLLFSDGGDLLVVDVDSFQTKNQPHSMVLLQDIQDFTATCVTKQTDIWAYDVLSFWATTYMHPFKWVAKDNKDTFEQKVRQGKSILSKIPNIKIPPIYEAPTGNTETQFKEIFSGRRYFVDFGNTVLSTSIRINNPVVSTLLTIRELFSNVTQVNVCGDYFSFKDKDGWSLVESKIPKVIRPLVAGRDWLYMFPSNKEFVTISKNGNTLFWAGLPIDFIQPEYFYYNGFLSVIDYATDMQHNFNLNNQLGGIDRTQTPVFAKSIVIRDTPIQNFGGKKYLNIPNLNSYRLIEVPLSTKNAIYDNGFTAVEYTERNQTKFKIFEGNKEMDLDYLPFFTTKGKMIVLPEDGFIGVYLDGLEITRLDASMCTRQSKLYSCNSGILLLENNILYLLNTK
jgi:hypothetical protein